jgi:hypothetical protein
MSDNRDDTEHKLTATTSAGKGLFPTAGAADQWEEMLEQTTTIPNRMIFQEYRDDPDGFRHAAKLMALAFFNRSNKIVVDNRPVYVQDAVPLMEASNEKLIQQLEYAEFSGDVPISEMKDRWSKDSYRIEIPDEE